MNKINIVGIGPGSPKYITPMASEIIDQAELLIGSKRSLELFAHKHSFVYENNLKELIEVMKKESKLKKIAVLVTGDTGFYSLLDYIKKHIEVEQLIVTPGISSFQYMFSCLKKSYKDFGLFSLHGRKLDLIDIMKNNKGFFLLTDAVNTPKTIARVLMESGYGNCYMAVGENLSYEDENIIEGKINKFTELDFEKLCVVVIEREMD